MTLKTTDAPNPNDLILHDEAARLLRVHPHVLHRWRAKGRVPAYRRGRRWFYDPAELLRLFERVEGAAVLPPTQKEREARAAAAVARMRAAGFRV